MVHVLLIGGASPFGLVLAKKLKAVGAIVHIFDTKQADIDNVHFILGSMENASLLRRSIVDHQITRLFFLPKITDEECPATVAQDIMLNTTALIEEVRNSHTSTSTLPQVIHIGQIDTDKTKFSPYKAAVLSTESFLHSYSMSYRMDVRLIRFHELTLPSEYERLAREILEISSRASDKIAKVHNLQSSIGEKSQIETNVEAEPIVRLLIYGANGWIGEQFIEILKKQNVLFEVAKERPGSVNDSKVCDEITKCQPSHVVCLIGRTHGPGCGNIDYLEGGPDKLTENVRDNLFAPWCLANICEKRGLHFTYLGTGCLFSYTPDNVPHKEDEIPNFYGNNYSVVKGFTDRLLPVFTRTLNVRIRLPINDDDSPRNLLKKVTTFKKLLDVENSVTYLPDLLPYLLSLILNRTVGSLNLVSPGSISYERMVEIYEEESGKKLDYSLINVKDNPDSVKNRAQCVLDTTRLVELQPNVLKVEDAVRKAAQQLIAQQN